MTRSKDIGTAAESAVVAYLRSHGFPSAERRALRGTLDCGDITGTVGLCWEIKAGHAAEQASDGRIEAWLHETETERRNADAAHGILVLKRKGKGAASAGQWWAVLTGTAYVHLATAGMVWEYEHLCPVRVLLEDAVLMLRHAGYGDRLPRAGAA